MATRLCEICGAEFTPNRPNQLVCSRRCQKKAKKRRERSRGRTVKEGEFAHAWNVSQPVPLASLMQAVRKPRNTSAIRWRMELRRRTNPERYEMAGRA